MTDDSALRQRRYRRNRLHFIWAMPAAGLLSIPMQLLAALGLCGISGCTGGGFGRSTPDFPLVVGALVIGGIVLALPVLAIPWTPRRQHRLVASLCVAIGFAALLFLLIDQRPGDLRWDLSGRS